MKEQPIVLLAGSGSFVGRAFAAELRRRAFPFVDLLRDQVAQVGFEGLVDLLRRHRPELVINTCGSPWVPGPVAAGATRYRIFQDNVVLPQQIARACLVTRTPWAHVSPGSVYAGAKVVLDGRIRVVSDLGHGEMLRLFSRSPERFLGFTEFDEPNVTFRSPGADFCLASRALAEEVLRGSDATYIWRFQPSFSETLHADNFLCQLLSAGEVRDDVFSLAHLEDAAEACLELWRRAAPYGIYNVANHGAIRLKALLQDFCEHFPAEAPPPMAAARQAGAGTAMAISRPGCVIDSSKLKRIGLRLRPVREALSATFAAWTRRGEFPFQVGPPARAGQDVPVWLRHSAPPPGGGCAAPSLSPGPGGASPAGW